jgi:hypothetical protein
MPCSCAGCLVYRCDPPDRSFGSCSMRRRVYTSLNPGPDGAFVRAITTTLPQSPMLPELRAHASQLCPLCRRCLRGDGPHSATRRARTDSAPHRSRTVTRVGCAPTRSAPYIQTLLLTCCSSILRAQYGQQLVSEIVKGEAASSARCDDIELAWEAVARAHDGRFPSAGARGTALED